MTDYKELVFVLRNCVLSKPCSACPYYDEHGPTAKCAGLNVEAADAIEVLSKTLCQWCGVCPYDKRDLANCEIYESCHADIVKEEPFNNLSKPFKKEEGND